MIAPAACGNSPGLAVTATARRRFAMGSRNSSAKIGWPLTWPITPSTITRSPGWASRSPLPSVGDAFGFAEATPLAPAGVGKALGIDALGDTSGPRATSDGRDATPGAVSGIDVTTATALVVAAGVENSSTVTVRGLAPRSCSALAHPASKVINASGTNACDNLVERMPKPARRTWRIEDRLTFEDRLTGAAETMEC